MNEKDEPIDNITEPSDQGLDEAAESLQFPDTARPAEESDPLSAMQAQRDEMEDKLKRTMADYQNFARRAQQNLVAASQQQLLEIVKKLVPVLDHLDHALAVDPEKTSVQDLLKGVGIVHDELMRTLAGFGVQRLDVKVGEAFDPNRHEALMRQPDTDIEPNHVTAQLQPGYLMGDKTIRPAKVSIAE